MLQTILILLLVLPSGCVTGGGSMVSSTDESGARLVERYKDAPPPWIQLEPGRLHADAHIFQFIEIRSRLPDLPIGVKESQLSALGASERDLRESIRQKIIGFAESSSFPLTGSMPKFDKILTDSTRGAFGRHGKVADIYIEKYAFDAQPMDGYPPVFFKTHILIQFPRSRVKEILRETAGHLERSNDSNLKGLGRLVKELAEEELSH
jgi:hypothetical protein